MVRLELSRPVVHRSSRETRVQLSFSPQHHTLVLEAVGKVLNPAVSQVIHTLTHSHTHSLTHSTHTLTLTTRINLQLVNTNLAANVS